MCPSALALGLGAGNCSSIGLRPSALTTVHSRSFHRFADGIHCIHGRFIAPASESFRVRRGEFSDVRGGFAGSSRDAAFERSRCCGRASNSGVVCRASNKRDLSLERSDRANEELLMFFFQLDLTTRLQRALNQDMYEAAQGLREKIAEVEREVARQRREKTGSGGTSKTAAHDTALTLLQTKAKLQRLIEKEDYEAAGAVRKKIMALEAESLAAQANAMIYQQRSFEFRLGQKVKHRVHGYRGVVCGMDPLCCEAEEWADAVAVDKLPRGRNQPFYQVLVDIREEPSVMVTYVAEDNLAAPEEPDFEQFDHPYVYFLFYGMDSAGDFIACKQLREKYDAPRHELPHEKEGD